MKEKYRHKHPLHQQNSMNFWIIGKKYLKMFTQFSKFTRFPCIIHELITTQDFLSFYCQTWLPMCTYHKFLSRKHFTIARKCLCSQVQCYSINANLVLLLIFKVFSILHNTISSSYIFGPMFWWIRRGNCWGWDIVFFFFPLDTE